MLSKQKGAFPAKRKAPYMSSIKAHECKEQIPFPSLAGQTVIVKQAVLLTRFIAQLRLPGI